MRMKLVIHASVLIFAVCLPIVLPASSNKTSPSSTAPAFLDVRLDAPVRFLRLKRGDSLEGTVTGNVFSGYRLIIPRGSRIHLTVSGMKRGRKEQNCLWPWPIRHFRPKYEMSPRFDFANVSLPDGRRIQLQVSAVLVFDTTRLTAKAKSPEHSETETRTSLAHLRRAAKARRVPGPRLQLVVRTEDLDAEVFSKAKAGSHAPNGLSLLGIETLSTGSKAKLALTSPLTASKSRAGDRFEAILEQPMRLKSDVVLPEGTVFEGRVTKSVPPRWLNRPGYLYLRFTGLSLPENARSPIAASVAGVDVSRQSGVKIGPEGGMIAGGPGKARLLLSLGVGAGISKVTDDGYQLLAEALISTATDASTAGMARLIGFAFSGLYLLTRRGRDVTLPRYTTITVRIDRSPSLSSYDGDPTRKSAR